MKETKEEWAENHGYSHYTCPKHGGFWSDSGPYCEECPEENEEITTDEDVPF